MTCRALPSAMYMHPSLQKIPQALDGTASTRPFAGLPCRFFIIASVPKVSLYMVARDLVTLSQFLASECLEMSMWYRNMARTFPTRAATKNPHTSLLLFLYCRILLQYIAYKRAQLPCYHSMGRCSVPRISNF